MPLPAGYVHEPTPPGGRIPTPTSVVARPGVVRIAIAPSASEARGTVTLDPPPTLSSPMTSAATPLWPDNPTAQDLLGFADIAEPVQEALLRERLDPVAVGVFGDWGSGKSTVLEILRERLVARGRVVVVYTRPWEYDPNIDPKATLIAEVLSAVRAEVSKDESRMTELAGRFRGLVSRVQWSKALTLVANSALTLSIPKISDVVGLFGEAGDDGLADPTLQGFREEFDELMAELEEIDRVVVLVDDLDRCLPDTVVAALEAMKLFLSVRKMGFVIAADRRLVTLAIASRYGQSAQGAIMAREYLEKIVQIPISVPTLGLADTEAYLAMMLLERHLDDAAMGRLAEHCDARRRAGEARTLEDLPAGLVPDKAGGELQLAGVLAPVLFRRLAGNPRRLKRFLNAFWLRSAVATRRNAALRPAALAKLLVLEELEPDAFSQLLAWLGDGELPAKLADLENPKGSNAGFPALREWALTSPSLLGEDLDPYLRLAASLRSLAAPGSGLRSELRDLLNDLKADSQNSRKSARKRMAALGAEDRMLVTRELVEVARTEPDNQDRVGEALEELMADETTGAEILRRLEELDAASVKPGLMVRITRDGPLKGDALVLIGRWRDSGRLDKIAEAAAAQFLAGQTKGS